MICTRFIEAFSPNSEEERMQVAFSDGEHKYNWKASRIISQGWREYSKESNEEQELLSSLPNIIEGEEFRLISTNISSHKTKAKPLYTEATLLTAMQNAGKEIEDTDSKKAIEDCGIGTPATRANIIETLILRGYIQREKKTLVPTEKGLEVYEIVKNKKIANAQMTGLWEITLSAIEAGKVSSSQFSEQIKEYTQQICEELLSLSPLQKSYPSYHCPKCKKQSVGIYSKIVKCKNENCDFHIYREVCGTFLSEDNIRDLLSTGRSPILKGLVSKKGKKFNARLVLQDDYKTSFEF